jgi:hypothetical protein
MYDLVQVCLRSAYRLANLDHNRPVQCEFEAFANGFRTAVVDISNVEVVVIVDHDTTVERMVPKRAIVPLLCLLVRITRP